MYWDTLQLQWVLLGYPALPSAISRGWWLMQGWGHLRSIFLPGFHYLSSISFGAGFSYFSTFGFISHCEIQRSSLMNAVLGRLLTFWCVWKKTNNETKLYLLVTILSCVTSEALGALNSNWPLCSILQMHKKTLLSPIVRNVWFYIFANCFLNHFNSQI